MTPATLCDTIAPMTTTDTTTNAAAVKYRELAGEMVHRGHGKPMARRKVDNNTYLERRGDDAIAVKLHATDVATFYADGTVKLDTGGWYTVTTKDRMNMYGARQFYPHPREGAGFTVYSERGEWRVAIGPDRVVRFFDGMRIRDGAVVNPEDGPDFDAVDAENKATEKAIAGYLKGLTPEVAERLRHEDSRGDCFYCQMVVTDAGEKTPLGEATGNTDHLRHHLDESYYMLSLVYNAHLDRGYGDPGLVASMHLAEHAEGRGGQYGLKHDLRRYLRRRLITGRAVR